MKKKTILLLASVIAYCYLFYGQSTGINALIFDTILIAFLLLIDKSLVKSKVWVAVAMGTLVSGTGALLYGNLLAAFGNVFSLILLAHLSVNKASSLFFSFIQAVCSYVMMPYYWIDRMVSPEPKPENASESKFSFGNLIKLLIPCVILLVFFLIYRNSNPIFGKFVSQINLDFLSWGFCWFLVFGMLLMYGFFYQKQIRSLLTTDQTRGNLLSGGIRENERSLFGDQDKEISAAVITFVLLNILLLFVNALDLQFILSGKQDGIVNYSKYVHQGINSSIFSVLIAILVTLYFFRGNLNFVSKSKKVRTLALIWILLNAVLLFTCLHKNMSYIQECGLTHKRIGVYFYLLLTFIGLVTTWIKITQLKSNWFLVRVNMWSLYLALVCSVLFNWNKIILDYNSKYKSSVEREYYLHNLSDTALPTLLENWESMPPSVNVRMSDVYFESMLEYRTAAFVLNRKKTGWQSWNFEDERIYRLIKQTNTKRAK